MYTYNIDFSNPGVLPPISVKTDDSFSRFFALTLWDGGAAYTVPSGALWAVNYKSPAGSGLYDAIIQDGVSHAACVVSGSTVTCEIAPAVLTESGSGQICLQMYKADGTRINGWNIPLVIEANPDPDSTITNSDYYSVLTAQVAQTLQYKNDAASSAQAAAASAALADLSNYYTKVQSDANYYAKPQIDANYYTKTQSDANYAPASSVPLMQGLTATVEPISTASQAYAVGDYFVYSGLLYKCTVAIAQGGTITPGTNCTATTAGAEISTLSQNLVHTLHGKTCMDTSPYLGHVVFSTPMKNTDYSIMLTPRCTVDQSANTSAYGPCVYNKTVNGFDYTAGGASGSSSWYVDWTVIY